MSRPEAARARPDRTAEGKPLSTESIATPTLSTAAAVAHCASCSSPLDFDQRYCLECGERCTPHDGVPPAAPHGLQSQQASPHPLGSHVHVTEAAPQQPTPSTPPRPTHAPPVERASEHSSATALLAAVGVLLLAMGVGVLIGRSGNPPQAAQPAPQVVTLTAPASSQPSPESNTTTPSAHHAPKAAKHPSGSRVGSSAKHPAPASVLDGLKGAKGKSYVEKSKNLPDVVSTG